jgi:SulP family sulfate permease
MLAVNRTYWSQFLPFLPWLTKIRGEDLRADFIAGLTGAVIVLPQGVAFATIAGMPPEYGLYAGMVPAVIAALFGSSHHLVSGPTTAASIVLFSALSAFAEPGSMQYVQLALTLTIMVGIIELVMGLARLGALVNFISHSVVLGFTAGAALLIAGNQIKHFFGLEMERGHLHEILFSFYRHAPEINLDVTAVGVATLVSGILVKRYLPRIPYMIAAMLVGSLVSVALIAWYGQDHTGIRTVGALPATLPPLSAPDFTFHTIKQLAPAALAVTLFALTEAVSIARSLAVRSGQNLDGNQEFIGQGLSNIAGSFFSGYVATGSFNRSGVNYEAGAKTPMAAMFAGSLLMVIVLLVAPLAAYLPNAAMAGILFLVAWGLIDFHHIAKVLQTSHSDSIVLIVTFLATLTLELEFAILLGVLLSLLLYLMRTARPAIASRVPDPRLPKNKFSSDPSLPECPQLKIVRIDGSLFFGAVSYVEETVNRMLQRNRGQKHLAISAQGINFIDVAGAEYLAREGRRRTAMGGGLYLINIKAGAWRTLERSDYLEDINPGHILATKTAAIIGIFQKLDHGICARCDKRIFRECASVPRIEENDAGQAPSVGTGKVDTG